MKIRFTDEIFHIQKVGGISRYFTELIKSFRELKHEPIVGGIYHSNTHLSNCGYKMGCVPIYLPKFPCSYSVSGVVASLPSLVGKQIDLNHVTYYRHERVSPKNSPFAVTFYDMIYEKINGDYSLLNQKAACAKKASVVFAISQATKNDILEFIDIDESKIHVVHLAASQVFSEPLNPCFLGNARQSVILWVGGRGGYKNFRLFLQAFSLSQSKKNGFKVLCVGPPFSNMELSDIKVLKLDGLVSSRICNDFELASLYRTSAMLAYLSLYEGFGIPPLEAMYSDCPVLACNSSSIPEVVGNAAFLVDGECVGEVAMAIDKICLEGDFRTRLVELGRKQATKFSWRICAEKTIDTYRDYF